MKIVAIVQQFQGEGSDHPITQAQTRNINDLDPDPDGDELTYLYDNCHHVYNPGQEDADGDEYGDACDACNGLVNIQGNVDLDASGGNFTPIIGVADVLALSDLLENVGLPPNEPASVALGARKIVTGCLRSASFVTSTPGSASKQSPGFSFETSTIQNVCA